MKKCLLFVALLIVSQWNKVSAQALFNAPDVVCINQPVNLSSNVNGSNYYWGFCSAFLFNTTPNGTNVSRTLALNQPSAIDVIKDTDQNYYGFVLNGASNEFLRYNYGKNINNVPTVTNFGSLSDVLPAFPSSLYIVKDTTSDNWYIFVSGGNDIGSSQLGRLDFGKSLANPAPNIVNFGNYGNLMNGPRGLFVAQEGDQWYGYVVNFQDNHLLRLEFEKNISNTPIIYDDGDLNGSMSSPTDLAAMYEDNNWYLFVTDLATSTLTRIDLGGSLANPSPVGNPTANFAGQISNPSSLTIARDCGGRYIYVTDAGTNSISRIDFVYVNGPYNAVDIGASLGSAGLVNPTSISRILRQHDNLYMFVTNNDNSLSKIEFDGCTSSTVSSSTIKNPVPFTFTTPGTYNLYFIVDEGLPTEQSGCKTIVVEAYPPITISPDVAICEGSSIVLNAISVNAISTKWDPDYNISSTTAQTVTVSPKFSLPYHIFFTYEDGCTVNQYINVIVGNIVADAGPDRVIGDGGKTILGGPFNTTNPIYTYSWSPNQFLSDPTVPNPVASPNTDFTYYLTVHGYVIDPLNNTDTIGCTVYDTVVVRVGCNDLNLPNAFAPGSGLGATDRFGLLNRQIVKLNFFRIFDRWGKMLFETNDPTNQWDGTVNGKPADFGVYVWEADGFCLEGKRLQKSGNVTLIR